MPGIAATIAPPQPRARMRSPADPWSWAMVGIAVLASLSVLSLLAVVFWMSFVEGSPGDPELVYTLEHYREIFLSAFTYRVLLNTLLFSGITLVVSLSLALPMAWLVERTDFPAKPVVFTFMTVALLIPGFAVALGWLFLLNPRIGIINQWMISLFGLSEAPFNIHTLLGMGLVEGLSLTPLTFIMTASVLRTMDSTLEEAASMGGCNLVQTLRRVTLPLIWPGVLAASIYVYMIGFAAFDIPAILGFSSRIYTFSTYVYEQISPTEGLPRYGGVATISIFMVAIGGFFSWWYRRVQRQAPKYAVITGKAYRPRIIRLGRYRKLAIALVACYFILAQVLPVSTLLWSSGLPYLQTPSAAALAQFSLTNYVTLPVDLVLRALENTAILMVVVPTIAVALSVAISWVVLRSKLSFRGMFDFFAFLPHAIPSIVFSVAAWLMALFVLRSIAPLYGTVWILVLVYVIVRLSYGTRMMNGALIQVHKELEESATVSGAGTGGVMRSVLLPLLRPAMLYSWIWIALLAYRELTLPVLLSTTNNQPLSVLVWSYINGSAYGKASSLTVIMLAIMFPILLLYWTAARRLGMTART